MHCIMGQRLFVCYSHGYSGCNGFRDHMKTFILLNFYYISTVAANFHGMVSNLLITESLYQQGDLRLIMCTGFIVADSDI